MIKNKNTQKKMLCIYQIIMGKCIICTNVLEESNDLIEQNREVTQDLVPHNPIIVTRFSRLQ